MRKKEIAMNCNKVFFTTLIASFLFASNVSAENSIAYTMNKDWKACKTSGIADFEEFKACTTYPDSGKDFETCENPPKAIYFVRHAERRFRDITGQNNAPLYILSIVGQKMAQHLAKIFEPVPVKAIYTSDYTRTRQTACPLMNSKKLDRNVVCKTETKSVRFLESALCKSHKDEVVVVVGHLHTIEEMLINLKVIHPLDNIEIKMGELYKVTFNKDGNGKLEQPFTTYWECDVSDCYDGGAQDVKLD